MCVCVRVLMCVHAGTHMEVKEPCVLALTLLLEIGSPVHCCPCQAGPQFSRAHLFPPPMSRQQDGDCRCVLCACLYLDSENANSGPHNLGSDLPPVPSQPLQEKGHGEDHVHEDTQSLRTLSSQVLTTLCQILQDQIKYHPFLDSFFQFLLEPKITA